MGERNVVLDYQRKHVDQVRDILHGIHPLSQYATFVLVGADSLLCVLIISVIPYTEIDWRAYMQQIEQVINGERDYTMIKGSTGPLVYPAAHVYLYWILYQITDQGRNILLAQCLFGVIYLATIIVVIICYKQAEVPFYVFPLLILSKRLHSIFILRLFNDCFAVLFQWISIYLFLRHFQTLGVLIYSFGLAIKMTLLLSFPAVGIILFLTKGISGSLKQIWFIIQIQIILAIPFLSRNALGYFNRAFQFSRKFDFKWTVNWRFVGEKTFLNKKFSIALLIAHLCTLILFATTRWLKPIQRPLKEIVRDILRFQKSCERSQQALSCRINAKFILTVILSANAIGFLFARSMHYQFYAYLAVASPFLLWRAGLSPILQYLLWALQEWAWNVYPSTDVSSVVIVIVQFFTIAMIWWVTRKDFIFMSNETLVTKKTS